MSIPFWKGLLERENPEPMNEAQTRLLVHLSIDRDEEKWKPALKDLCERSLPLHVFMARFGQAKINFNETFDSRIAVFFSLKLFKPGQAVMWTYTLHCARLRCKKEKYDLTQLCEDFPMGFPSVEQEDEVWDEQKGEWATDKILLPKERYRRIDNCLDHDWFWPTQSNYILGIDPETIKDALLKRDSKD